MEWLDLCPRVIIQIMIMVLLMAMYNTGAASGRAAGGPILPLHTVVVPTTKAW